MHQPLEGIRILEWGTFHGGPGGNAILGDLGAEVIKIEQPNVGDPMRHQWRYGEASFNIIGGRNLFFEAGNRNKKGITIDLKQEKGREIAYRLVAKSDAFLTNFRQKLVENMGMSYQKLSEVNPQLIYASVSAYGPNGPDSHQGGFDFQAQGRSGIMFAMGEPDMTPLVLHFGVIDQVTAIMVSHALLTAILMRERFGIGQQVHVSLLGSALCLQYLNVFNALWMNQAVTRHKRTKTDPLRNYYQCMDGKWLCTGFPMHWENKWPSICQALGLPELQNNPKFDTREKRLKNSPELIKMLDDHFATKPRDKWLEIFSHTDLICCAVNTHLDLEHDPQVIENDYIVDFDDPVLGKVKIPGYPVQFSQTNPRTVSLGPGLGEHTREILKSLGEYSDEEIDRFEQEGVI